MIGPYYIDYIKIPQSIDCGLNNSDMYRVMW